jgi:putative phage-type endonuclease
MIIQGSEEWFTQRLGKVTASRLADVLAKTKTGPSASRANYMAELIAERLSGVRSEKFVSAEMKWGTECEPLARAAYEAETGAFVCEVGMITHPAIPMAGASPDGLISDDGVLEIKCPETKTHFETILCGEVPTKYIPQIQWQLACTERAWCDYVSFDPRSPADLQLFVKRVPRDGELIKKYEAEVLSFLEELESRVSQLNAWRLSKTAERKCA